MMAVASLLVSCNSHPKFETSTDAVEVCKKELAALKGEKEMSIEQLTKATSSWLEMQDSAYSVFSRDTSINLRSPVALAFFYSLGLYSWRVETIGFFPTSEFKRCDVSQA